ncbi:MAG: hypothetical protein HY646_00605 [Acidobacteria bacterium]|nr:hypothetical protein [Acidobacteriota bacterium]
MRLRLPEEPPNPPLQPTSGERVVSDLKHLSAPLTASLAVAPQNAAAIALYRRAGFEPATVVMEMRQGTAGG